MAVSKIAGILIGTILMSVLPTAVLAHAADDDGLENGYRCESATIRYVGQKKINLPFSGDIRDSNDAPDTKVVNVYNTVAVGCEAVGNAPKNGASRGMAMVTHDLESPYRADEGRIHTFEGTFVIKCRELDAGDGNGVVTGAHCLAIDGNESVN